MPLGVTMYHGDFDGVAPACECEGAHHDGEGGDHDGDHDGHEAESDAAAATRLLGAAALAAAGVVALA